MNQHQQINNEFERQYALLSDAVYVMPSALAHGAFEVFASGKEGAHIQYTSLEHLKQMARKFLARKKDADGEENTAHVGQDGFDFGTEFSGQLQDRYPARRKAGEEPIYVLRKHMSKEDRDWNVQQLRKSAMARQEHADALEAEGQMGEAL